MATPKKILIYATNPDSPAYKALKQVFETLFDTDPTRGKIKMSSDLEKELATGEFGLVIDAIGIDTSVMMSQTKMSERYSRDSHLIRSLDKTVDIRFASNTTSLVSDIIAISAAYLGQGEQ
jgi:hypothetical protein